MAGSSSPILLQRYVAFKSKRDKDDEEKRLEKDAAQPLMLR